MQGAGSSIAAHVRHLEYGLSLLNRWASGEENPFKDANWSASWEHPQVSDREWDDLRASFGRACQTWQKHLASDRTVRGMELDGVIGSVVHLAYHLGAIRQINPALRGPAAND